MFILVFVFVVIFIFAIIVNGTNVVIHTKAYSDEDYHIYFCQVIEVIVNVTA